MVVHPGQVRIAAQCHEAGVRQEGRELAAPADRHGTVAAAVENEGGGGHVREHCARVGREVVLERGRRHIGVRRESHVAAEGRDLDAARVWDEEPCQHLRRQRPVDADEVDDRATRCIRDVVPGRVAAEEDELAHPLGEVAREARHREPRAGAAEERGRPAAAGIEDRPELPHVGHVVRATVGEADAEPVVAHDAVRLREILEEAARVRDPTSPPRGARSSGPRRAASAPRRRSRRRSGARRARSSGSPARGRLTMARIYMARSGHVNEMARAGEDQRRRRGIASRSCMRRMSTGSRSGRCETATPRRSWRCSTGSASAPGRRASVARSRGSPTPSWTCSRGSTANRHVLVGYVDGDPRPAGIAQARPGRRARRDRPERRRRAPRPWRGNVFARGARGRRPRRRDHVLRRHGVRRQPVHARASCASLSTSLEVRWQRGEREIVVPLGA